MQTIHPRTDDHGQPVIIKSPITATPLSAWSNPLTTATVIPDGPMPTELNGTPFEHWHAAPTTASGWNTHNGLKPDLIEPVMEVPSGKKAAVGVVIVENDGRVWVVHPSNGYGRYSATWPKGRVESGMYLQAAAIKEAWEESGLRVRTTHLLGDFTRTTTLTRYYLAKRIGGSPSATGWESQAVSLIPAEDLPRLLNGIADAPILATLMAKLASSICNQTYLKETTSRYRTG